MKNSIIVLIIAFAMAIILALPILAIAENIDAEDFIDAIGKVLVDEEIDGVLYTIEKYDPETWIIPVKTEYGIVHFYADNPAWEGDVYLLLFGEDLEVIDAFMVNELEAPFGEFSFFYFYGSNGD